MNPTSKSGPPRSGHSSLGKNRSRNHRSDAPADVSDGHDLIPPDLMPSGSKEPLDSSRNDREDVHRFRKDHRKMNLFKDRRPFADQRSERPRDNNDESDNSGSDSGSDFSADYSISTEDLVGEISDLKMEMRRMKDHVIDLRRYISLQNAAVSGEITRRISSRIGVIDRKIDQDMDGIREQIDDLRKSSEQRHISVLSHLIVASGVLFMKKEQNAEALERMRETLPQGLLDNLTPEFSNPVSPRVNVPDGDQKSDQGDRDSKEEDTSDNDPADQVRTLLDTIDPNVLRSILQEKLSSSDHSSGHNSSESASDNGNPTNFPAKIVSSSEDESEKEGAEDETNMF